MPTCLDEVLPRDAQVEGVPVLKLAPHRAQQLGGNAAAGRLVAAHEDVVKHLPGRGWG